MVWRRAPKAKIVESLKESLKKPCEAGQYLHMRARRIGALAYFQDRRWSRCYGRVGRRKDGLKVSCCHCAEGRCW